MTLKMIFPQYFKNDDNEINSKMFCEMLIGRIRIVQTDLFSEVTNIRKNLQNDYSLFEMLMHEVLIKEPSGDSRNFRLMPLL